jgi:hypothetical protein
MSDVHELRRVAGECLARAARLEKQGEESWRVSLHRGGILRAQLDEGWLVLAADCAELPAGDPAVLLRRNAELGGGVKFAYAAAPPVLGAEGLQLRAEVPLSGGEEHVKRRVGDALAGFAEALDSQTSGVAPSAEAVGGEAPIDLASLLAEAGWPFDQRPDGTMVVDLAVPDGFFQAEIESRRGRTRLAASISSVANTPDTCRRALSALLLRAAGAVRMARPALPAGEGPPRIEVVLAGALTATEIDHALAALAVACRLCGREAALLQDDEAISARYLARFAVNVEGAAPSAPHTSFAHEGGSPGAQRRRGSGPSL